MPHGAAHYFFRSTPEADLSWHLQRRPAWEALARPDADRVTVRALDKAGADSLTGGAAFGGRGGLGPARGRDGRRRHDGLHRGVRRL